MPDSDLKLTDAIPTITSVSPDRLRRMWRGPGWRGASGTVRSVRTYIFGLILAVLLPSLVFSGFLVRLSARHEQDSLASTVRERAETAAEAVDMLLSAVRGQLFGLASAERVDGAGLKVFYQRASQIIDQRQIMVALSDATGQQIFNTRAPLGDSLPMAPDLGAIRRVVETGMPYISNLGLSALTREPEVTVNVPLMRDGKVAYVLSANVLPLVRDLLPRLHLPADWLCMISDRAGYTIARTRAGNRFVGQISRPGFLARVRSADHGWFSGVSRDGVPSYVGFTHARLAGWNVAVAIPAGDLLGPVHRSTRLLLLAGMAILSLALLAAFIIARRISRPIVRLVADARAVGGGAQLSLRPTGLRETDAVMRSLHLASDRLARHAAERDEAMVKLRDSEQGFRGLAEELAQVNAERTRLLHGTVQAQESERARLARELHDSLGQYVTALHLGLKAIEVHCAPDAAGRGQLAALNALTTDVGRELNRLAWELRPTALDDLGLETAVRQLVEDWAERSRLQFDLHVALVRGERLPANVETTLYRALQEAITNVVKHAGAARVSVILEALDSEARLIVEDDGRGIAQVAVGGPGTQDTRRLGLVGMRERLALVRGALEVECTAGKGTTLFVRVPL